MRVAFIATALIIISGCSTKKNSMMSRTFHNLTAYYNVYFNGVEAFESGLKQIDETHKDNFSIILPVFTYSNVESARSSFGDMNRAIEKGSKCIRKHSITAKPGAHKAKKGKGRTSKKKPQEKKFEYVKWIDDSYLLIGKASFYKRDFFPAIETFNYLIKQYSTKPIKYNAYLWLARTYIEMEKYKKAGDFLSIFETDKGKFPEELIGPIEMTWADLHLKQNKYLEALTYLEKGVISTKKKKEKVRYYYILAQVYQYLGDNTKAYEAYGEVIDLNPNYDMTFNARINRASIFNSDAEDSRSLVKALNKMLRDDKNIDYRDQIYYALGNIAYNEGHVQEGIDLFKLSAKTSTENTNQKGISFLAIADIYFEKPEYKEAQTYYDSAVSFLSSEYPDFHLIKRKSDNLNDLVNNLNTVELQDSLQKLAKMSEANRYRIIDALIAAVIEKEQEEKEAFAQQQADLAQLQQNNTQTNNEGGGKWYFYNPMMLSMGQAEFSKKWGSRKNEDNWRRANKEEINWDGLTASEDTTKTDSNAVVLSNKSREYYSVNIPLTDSAMKVSKIKVEEAFYNIATIYKDKFYDYPLSIDGYQSLLNNFPETEYKLSTYYNMYKVYVLSKEPANAELYKNKILTEYPDSDYAKILRNPEYYKELEAIENQVNFVYKATYKYFLASNCGEVAINYKFVDSAYPLSKLLPKFDLLNTLCSGTGGDTILFKQELTAFKERRPETEEAKYAQEVLDALDRETREIKLKEEEEKIPDEFAAGETTDSIDYSLFEFNADIEHVYMVVVANEVVDANRVKFNLSNFNLDYYDFLNFEVNSILLSAKYSAISVTKFKNSKMASNYFESVLIAGETFDNLDKDGYRTYIISKPNYTKFLEDKNIPRYNKFFENYHTKISQH